MERIAQFWRRLLFYLWREQFDRELEEEMRFHLEMKAEENLAAGVSPEEARYAAQRQFGNQTLLWEVSRDMWSFRFLETLAQDLRYGLWMMIKNPGFTAMAALTLALGIGANMAIFSVVNSVLLRPLPYRDPHNLLTVWETFRNQGQSLVSVPNFQDWQRENHVFADLAAFSDLDMDIALPEGTERLYAGGATANLLTVLGTQPALGRNFQADEEARG